jgi:uncharacterized HhH-GPD family protein
MAAPDHLWFTDDEEACALLAREPMALLVGFALDQQVTVQKAFAGPLELQRRVGSLDAGKLVAADLDSAFREKPALHRFPGAMAERVQALAAHVVEHYDGDAGGVWESARSPEELKANISSLPGFGEMKVKSLGAVLAKRFDLELAQPLVPPHPTLGDVDSPRALEEYQAAKRLHKAQWSAGKS